MTRDTYDKYEKYEKYDSRRLRHAARSFLQIVRRGTYLLTYLLMYLLTDLQIVWRWLPII